MNELDRYLNRWLRIHGFDCSVIYKEEWFYDLCDEYISYSLILSNTCDELFFKVCEELGIKMRFSNFVVSFFHELGHHETLDFFSDEIIKRDEKYADDLAITIAKTLEDENNLHWSYYHLETEITATEWGVEFINTHLQTVKKFEEDVENILTKCRKVV